MEAEPSFDSYALLVYGKMKREIPNDVAAAVLTLAHIFSNSHATDSDELVIILRDALVGAHEAIHGDY